MADCPHRRVTYAAPLRCEDCGAELGGSDVMTTEAYVQRLRARGMSEQGIADLLRWLEQQRR